MCRVMWRETVSAQCALFAFALPIVALGGAYVGTWLGESRSVLADFHLGVRAWLAACTTHVADLSSANSSIAATRSLLPVHFVWVLQPRRWNGTAAAARPADPFQSLTTAQSCAIEAALRLSPHVTLWVVGTSLLSPEQHRKTWVAWRKGLEPHHPTPLGELSVRAHRFSASSAVGAWLRARGASAVYDAHDWTMRRWPTHPAAVSDLVRLDVLETSGGVYLDLDVIALEPALLRLQDGLGLQAYPPWLPLRAASHSRPLYELLNNAVLISAAPNGSLPRRIARSALLSLESSLESSVEAAATTAHHRLHGAQHGVVSGGEAWGVLGPRAATEAWVGLPAWRRAPWRVYEPTLFGFVTCGREHAGTVRCVEYSSSDLPLDCETDEAGWRDFARRRLAQHGVKNLRFHGRQRAWRGPTCAQGPGTPRARIAMQSCPASWELAAKQSIGPLPRRSRHDMRGSLSPT